MTRFKVTRASLLKMEVLKIKLSKNICQLLQRAWIDPEDVVMTTLRKPK